MGGASVVVVNKRTSLHGYGVRLRETASNLDQATNGSKSCDDQPEADPRMPKMTLYEKLRAALEGDPKVAKEVALGTRVGFYRMKGQLGAGNFSKVKLGLHLLTNGELLINELSKKNCVDDL